MTRPPWLAWSSVRGNKVYFEDQPLTDPEIVALEEACRATGR